MIQNCTSHRCPSELGEPKRNNYFFGKQMDVYQFQLETNYLNAKRWLLNRTTLGFGVVCGLDVESCSGDKELLISAGLAIDGWGREIIVPKNDKIDLKQKWSELQQEPDQHTTSYLVLRYVERTSEPEPVYASECSERVQPGLTCEGYDISLECKPPSYAPENAPCDIMGKCDLDQVRLAKFVAENCVPCPANPAVLLATITPPNDGSKIGIDIKTRPIVYRNALLFDLLKCLVEREHH